MKTIDLDQLEWVERKGPKENYYLAHVTETIYAVYDINFDHDCRATMSLHCTGSLPKMSSKTRDWSVFDKLFGRKQWQAFLEQKQAEAKAELELDV